MQGFEQFLLRRGQANIAPITSSKAGIGHFHLFPFDVAGQSTDKNDDIRSSRCIECFFEERFGAGWLPGKPHLGIAQFIEVFELYVVRMASFEIEECTLAL